MATLSKTSKKLTKLYITDNLSALDRIAQHQQQFLKECRRIERLKDVARVLFRELNDSFYDQEKAYIIGKRYLNVLDRVYYLTKDKQFIELRYSREYSRVKNIVEELRQALQHRYGEEKTKISELVISTTTPPLDLTLANPETEKFLNCRDLYVMLTKSDSAILLIDVRPRTEFQESRIIYKQIINIPKDCLTPGLSANTLGHKLPQEVQELWEKRDEYPLVLIDWNSNSENVCSPALEKLRSILIDWDFNKHYTHLPLILNGGYKEFIDTYPSLVTNLHVYLIHKNNELDELLDIDSITYPSNQDAFETEFSSEETSPVLKVKRAKSQKPSFKSSSDPCLTTETESEKLPIAKTCSTLTTFPASKPESKPDHKEPLNLITAVTINQLRYPGLAGLKNIRNTCYMNTIFQCFRCLPDIRELFLTGNYRLHLSKRPPRLIQKAAELIQALWREDNTYPPLLSIYSAICSEIPEYSKGDHEDCMEFFLYFFNTLSEDCTYDLTKPIVLTPKEQAMFSQLQGKSSIFTTIFYHQLKIQRVCESCSLRSYSFETDNSLMLSLPEKDTTLEDILENYFKDFYIKGFFCSKCKKQVVNKKTVEREPKVLVIVLKRCNQCFSDVVKNDVKIYFDKDRLKFGKSFYKLYGLCLHHGSSYAGHYVAACLVYGKWYLFNDETVCEFDIGSDLVCSSVCSFFYVKED